jgi:5S rRNA maturation endonuclease (ribonuclease M5)
MVQTEELETFKTEINLVEYAESQGYEIDRKKSSKNCLVLKDTRGDKILVGVDRNDGHYFYCSVNDDRDKGSIIDFIQKRDSLNLGEVRKELRRWLRSDYAGKPKTAAISKPIPTTKERHQMTARFEGMKVIENHPYLNKRGIFPDTIESVLFRGTIYADKRNNVIFPHHDEEGICGYEIRNDQYKGYSEGGTKGLWHSQENSEDKRLVICESPIDCLSYYYLFDEGQTRYVATGGTLSEKQKDLIREALAKIQGGEIIIATDRDEAGEKLAGELGKLAPEGSRIFRHCPENQKDWNEALTQELRERYKARERALSADFEL